MPATDSRLSSFLTVALGVAAVAVLLVTLRRAPSVGQALRLSNDYVGRPAPDFSLPDLNGQEVTLSSLKGHVVVLDLWATWCPPCVAELPAVTAMTAAYADRGVRFHAVNLGEPSERVRTFLSQRNLAVPVLLDESERVGVQYGAQYIPLLVVIDATGRIVAHGNVPPDEVQSTLPKWIESALKSGQAS